MDEHEDIFRKVIPQAVARGFDDSQLKVYFRKEDIASMGSNLMLKALAHSPHSLIFRHDFAKAFWGEEKILEEYPLSDGSGEYLKIWMPAWQAHLRKMVLHPDPIMYFKPFV